MECPSPDAVSLNHKPRGEEMTVRSVSVKRTFSARGCSNSEEDVCGIRMRTRKRPDHGIRICMNLVSMMGFLVIVTLTDSFPRIISSLSKFVMRSFLELVEGLRAPLVVLSSGIALKGEPVISSNFLPTGVSPSALRIRAATQSVGSGGGTKSLKKLKVIQEGDKSGKFRNKVTQERVAIKLLSRVEQLRLLSKAEKAGLLSAAERAGFSLSSIEKLGLLSKAEEFGALSAATDPKTPSLLLVAALGLLVLGPAFVYFVPEDSTPLVVIQVIVATVSVLGGSAAFAASSFVSALQGSD